MEHRIIVAGIGPGHPDYMVPEARRAIEEARFLVGGRRALAQYAQRNSNEQKTFPVTRDIPGVLDFIAAALEQSDIVVMVSGDPGYYSLLDALRRRFSAKLFHVIPGISSFQLAFARLSLPWHEACLLSFHGRVPREEDLTYTEGKILGMLTDHVHTSQIIAKKLLSCGWPSAAFFAICARLSYADEQVLRLTLEEAARHVPVSSCIIIVCDKNNK